jgi:hypothetical protein
LRAPPRRELPRYHLLYRNFLNAVLDCPWKNSRDAAAKSVGAVWRGPESVSRAMVVGMAMALAAAPSLDWELTVNRSGNVYTLMTMGATKVDLGAPVDIGMVIMPYTPIHIGFLSM